MFRLWNFISVCQHRGQPSLQFMWRVHSMLPPPHQPTGRITDPVGRLAWLLDQWNFERYRILHDTVQKLFMLPDPQDTANTAVCQQQQKWFCNSPDIHISYLHQTPQKEHHGTMSVTAPRARNLLPTTETHVLFNNNIQASPKDSGL